MAERGQAVGETVRDHANVLPGLLPSTRDTSYVCWRFIDRYADTTFNHLQMEPFLEELERLRDGTPSDIARELLVQIEALAHKCQDNYHLCLKFEGD